MNFPVLEPLAASEVGDSLRSDLDKWSAREATLSELSTSGLPTQLSKEGFLLDKFSLIGGRWTSGSAPSASTSIRVARDDSAVILWAKGACVADRRSFIAFGADGVDKCLAGRVMVDPRSGWIRVLAWSS